MHKNLVSATDPFPLSRGRGCSEFPRPAPRGSRLRKPRLLRPDAVTCPPGEAGAERRGWWGRGMARCAAQGGWHKRRRRGRRKNLGEETVGRAWSGAEKALEAGRRREPGGVRGRAPSTLWRSLATLGRGGGVGRGGGNARRACYKRRPLGGLGGEQGAGGGGGEGWGHGVPAALRPCLRLLLCPEGPQDPHRRDLGGGRFFRRPFPECMSPSPPFPLSLWTLLPRVPSVCLSQDLPSVWVCVSP